jgi:hypothetical protein
MICLFKYRIIGYETKGELQEVWYAQRRFILWPFWSHVAWHSNTGHDWMPTTFRYEEEAIEALPKGVTFRTLIRIIQ